jgi:hypothetical protein
MSLALRESSLQGCLSTTSALWPIPKIAKTALAHAARFLLANKLIETTRILNNFSLGAI